MKQNSRRKRGKKARPPNSFFQGYASITRIYTRGYLTKPYNLKLEIARLHSAEQSSSRIRGKKARPHKAFFQGYISIIQIHKRGYLTNLEP
jgi:hypothetical protein